MVIPEVTVIVHETPSVTVKPQILRVSGVFVSVFPDPEHPPDPCGDVRLLKVKPGRVRMIWSLVCRESPLSVKVKATGKFCMLVVAGLPKKQVSTGEV